MGDVLGTTVGHKCVDQPVVERVRGLLSESAQQSAAVRQGGRGSGAGQVGGVRRVVAEHTQLRDGQQAVVSENSSGVAGVLDPAGERLLKGALRGSRGC